MADLLKLSENIRASIAEQIAERLPRSSLDALAPPGAVSGLGESLTVVLLSQDAVQRGTGPLAARIQRTGQWYHQVYEGGAAVRFAKSESGHDSLGEAHQVVEVAKSNLPQAIRTTISWIDENIKDDGLGELLVAPAYFLTAIWIHSESIDIVVIASRPDRMRELLPLNVRMEGTEFLRRLAAATPSQGAGSPYAVP